MEIGYLEDGGGAVGTKVADAFKRPPLRGLKKKHYRIGSPQSVVKNIVNAIKGKKGLCLS
jgi:hypothetical protein